MNATVGERKCALLLAALREDDRAFLLAKLPVTARASMASLIREVKGLGATRIDLDAVLSEGSLSSMRLGAVVSDIDGFDIEQLPRGLPEVWRKRIEEAAGQARDGGTQGAHQMPSKLQHALLEEARALIARETVAA